MAEIDLKWPIEGHPQIDEQISNSTPNPQFDKHNPKPNSINLKH